MTSRLLRKLQTTLWSMLPKTERISASAGLAEILRDAGLVGLAALTLVSSAAGQEETNRSRLAYSGRTAAAVPTETPSRSPLRRVNSIRLVSASSDVPGSDLAFEPTADRSESAGSSEAPSSTPQQPEMPPVSAPEIAAQARQHIAGESAPQHSRVPKSDEGFSARMDYVLSGGIANSSSSVGQWWQERTDNMMSPKSSSHSGQRRRPLKSLARSNGQRADHVTLPPEPEADEYDPGAIAVFAGGIEQAGAQESSDEAGDPDVSSSVPSRLRTDIRDIQPTLRYALKNIEKDQLPEDFDTRANNGEYQARQSSPTVYQWAPTNFWHYPLYFQDPSLERYGHTYHPVVQPFASSGLFATQLMGLPYQMALHPAHSKQYALGYYRPGECAPKKHYAIPFNEEATLVEVATIAGLILIIP